MARSAQIALRPPAALIFAGVVAALVVFMLLTAPPGRVSEAQDPPGESVLVTATATSVVIDVKGANLSTYLGFTLPGYSGTTGNANHVCGVTVVDGDGNNMISTNQHLWRCLNEGSVRAILYLFRASSEFRMTITNLQYDSTVGDDAARRLVTLQRANSAPGWRLNSPQSIFGDDSSQYGFRIPGRVADFNAVSSGSTNTHASVQFQVYIAELPIDLPTGGSIVLYLEDDYFVPEPVDHRARNVWFNVGGIPYSGELPLSQPGRHYLDDAVELERGDYFGGENDHAVRVYLPDLFPGKRGAAIGFQGAKAGQNLTLTISKNAGIKNPTEEGGYRISYAVLGPDDAVPDRPDNELDLYPTYATFALSDDDDARGKTIAAAGAGFNDGVTATLYMKHYATAGRHPGGAAPTEFADSGDPNAARAGDSPTGDIMTLAETCADIIATGAELGSAVVSSDNRAEIEFTIANPPFQPGSGNLLCMQDGEARAAETDVEHFNLSPSIRVNPNTISAGQSVVVDALDFPPGLAFGWVTVAGQQVTPSNSSAIGDNGKGGVTFNIPGSVRDTVSLAACWGGANAADCAENGHQESANINVTSSTLSLSKDAVRPNESIIIRGAGFGTAAGAANDLASITIDDVPLLLADDDRVTDIEVSNGGQFSTTVVIWGDADNNPALAPGTHRIRVADKGGYYGEANITILEPTVSVTPAVAGPRDYVVISGANWPVVNDDGGDLARINISISGGGIAEDTEQTESDANGAWSIRWRIPGAVAIPSALTATATYGAANDISRLVTFNVPSSNLRITPNMAPSGAEIVLNGSGFAPFESSIAVKIGPNDVAVPTGTTTDRAGNLADLAVRVPSLDDGAYTVQLKVGGAGGTVAIGEIQILADARGATDLIEGLAPLGDNLVRVFYFNNAAKFWTFYDPRPDFDDLNTQTTLAAGHSYWILVDDTQTATLNGQSRTLACHTDADGRRNCWNNIVW